MVKDNTASDVQMILLGNKVDMEDQRQVTFEEGKKFADECGIQFYETSASTGQCVEEAFQGLLKNILSHDKKQAE